MAFINTDWSKELEQVEATAAKIVDNKLSPMIKDAISQAGQELSQVVAEAGNQIESNIKVLSEEIHNQRSLTKDELIALIDYATGKLAITIDQRLTQAKAEASSLVSEKLAQLKIEFEDAAIKSRKTLYTNIAFSVATAIAMAVVSIIYKRISLGELDVFVAFRVFLLSTAVGTGLFSALKALTSWNSLNRTKKNIATTLLGYVGILRPNGALGLLLICLLLFAGWFLLTYYVH
ncbi:hypothetical protein [Vogesella indigofera]|uniref:Uncharacterized protein n=1 Tax=Vogesella indigofera TaxID=45465 RepID=A0ABT5I2H5_VOGIN|nr:hypothetical protein [Vogesella indigofera]MDC7690381.1 hypothetical protein [Vogesella indigofera]